MRRLSNLAGHIELVVDRVLPVEQDLDELCEDLQNILSPKLGFIYIIFFLNIFIIFYKIIENYI